MQPEQLYQVILQLAEQQSPQLARWMAPRRAVLLAVIGDALRQLDAPEPELDDYGDPIPTIVQTDTIERTFVMPRSKIKEATLKAQNLGLIVQSIDDVPVEELASLYRAATQERKRREYGDYQLPSLTPEEIRSAELRAEQTAPRWVRLTVSAPPAEAMAVGKAELLEGDQGRDETVLMDFAPQAWEQLKGAVPGQPFEVDFSQCDACGIRHKRKHIWLLNDGRVVGGQCAANLDLSRKLKTILGALDSFASWFSVSGQDEDEEFPSGPAGQGNTEDPVFLYTLADVIMRDTGGHVSRSKVEMGQAPVSTTDEVRAASMGAKGYGPTLKTVREETASGLAQRRYDDAVKVIQEEIEAGRADRFLEQIAVGLRTGNLKLLGVIAYAPEMVRRILANRQRVAQAASEFAYTPILAPDGPVATEAQIRQIAMDSDLEPEQLGAILGRKAGEIERALKKGQATKTLHKALSRFIPGRWLVEKIRSFENEWGWTYFLSLRRPDGARITWKSSSLPRAPLPEHLAWMTQSGVPEIKEGDTLQLLSASIGDIRDAKQIGDRLYPASRMINRVSAQLLSTAEADFIGPEGVAKRRRDHEMLRRARRIKESLSRLNNLVSLRPWFGEDSSYSGPWRKDRVTEEEAEIVREAIAPTLSKLRPAELVAFDRDTFGTTDDALRKAAEEGRIPPLEDPEYPIFALGSLTRLAALQNALEALKERFREWGR